jgi:hypothetical protein
MTTVDGYYEGPNQEFDFWVTDDEFNRFAVEQVDEVDTLLFGRVTYEGMAAYWPTPAAEQDDPEIAARMNGLSKIVASRTLDKTEWANTRLISGDVADELTKVKEQPGKDIAILASSDPTGEPPGDGTRRRSADHGESRRPRCRQVGVQDGRPEDQPEAPEDQALRLRERPPLLPARARRPGARRLNLPLVWRPSTQTGLIFALEGCSRSRTPRRPAAYEPDSQAPRPVA